MPHDDLAEQSVLGSMMLSAAALWEVLDGLVSSDFYQPRNAVVFDAIAAVAGRNDPVDALSVSDELQRSGMVVKAGGVDYVMALTSVPSTPANAAYHAEIVKDRALRRLTVETGFRVVELGFSPEGDPVDQVEAARMELGRVSSSASVEVAAVGQEFAAVADSLDTAPATVPSPWPELDEVIVGFEGGRLYVLGARPGEGKTMMGLQIAMALANSGPVAFTSLEMSRQELMLRMMASRATVPMANLSRRVLTDVDWDRLRRARPGIERLPLFIDDRSGLTVQHVKAFARTVARKGKLGGVVVDYLQLMQGGVRGQDRHEVVAEMSRQLKAMARELGCPVIALSQLNRGSAGEGKQRRAPSLADLRESGAIEQDADVVVLLQRQLEDDGEPGDRLTVIVPKNRHGRTGRRTLLWEGKYARVSSFRSGPELVIPE